MPRVLGQGILSNPHSTRGKEVGHDTDRCITSLKAVVSIFTTLCILGYVECAHSLSRKP